MTEYDNSQKIEAPRIGFMVSREVRHVPLDWKHPVDERGVSISLHDYSDFSEDLVADYNEDAEEGETYTREQILSWHMPDFSGVPEEQMGICAYETCSEGSPISPVYPNTPEGRFQMVKHCSENETTFGSYTADIEAWAGILFGKNAALVDMHTGRLEMSDSGGIS